MVPAGQPTSRPQSPTPQFTRSGGSTYGQFSSPNDNHFTKYTPSDSEYVPPEESPSRPSLLNKWGGATWYGLGAGIGVVVLVVVFTALLLLGDDQSPTTQTAAGTNTTISDLATSATSGESSNSGSANPATAAPSTPAITTALDLVGSPWQQPASWAISRCKLKELLAVTSLETSSFQIAICTPDPSSGAPATFQYSGVRKSDNSEYPLLPTTYDEGTLQFTAIWEADQATIYTVTPSTLRIDSGSRLLDFEFISDPSARNQMSRDNLLAQLVALLQSSSTYRTSLIYFVNNTFGGPAKCLGAAEASTLIKSISNNRQQMSMAADQLVRDSEGTDIQPAAVQFARAMKASYEQDQLLIQWTETYWSPFASRGCTGRVTEPRSAFNPRYQELDREASDAKTQTASLSNSLVAGTSFQGGWSKDNI